MPKTKLTKSVIGKLPITKKSERYFDTELEGFFVRVHPTGRMSYGFRTNEKRLGKPNKTEETIGSTSKLSLVEARDSARRKMARVLLNGGDLKSNIKIEDVIEEYHQNCRDKKMRSSTLAQKENLSRKHVIPYFSDVKVADITRRSIQGLLKKLFDEEKEATSNAVRTYLIGLLKFAIFCEYIDENPAIQTAALGAVGVRERYLSCDEIRTLLNYLNRPEGLASRDVNDCVKLLLLTGCRVSEVVGMKWDELDFTKREWIIPASRTKSKRDFWVYLTDEFLAILNQRKREANGRVFEIANKSVTQFLKRISIDTETITRPFCGKFTAHDLRRTFATQLAGNLKIDEETIKRLLNHAGSREGAIKHYNKYAYDEEKRIVLIQWGRYLRELNDYDSFS